MIIDNTIFSILAWQVFAPHPLDFSTILYKNALQQNAHTIIATLDPHDSIGAINLTLNTHLAPGTCKAYLHHQLKFCQFLLTISPEFNINQLKITHVIQFFWHEIQRGINPRTVQNARSAISKLFSFLDTNLYITNLLQTPLLLLGATLVKNHVKSSQLIY